MKLKFNLYMLKTILTDFGSMVWVSSFFSLKKKIGQKPSQSLLPFGVFIWIRDDTTPNMTSKFWSTHIIGYVGQLSCHESVYSLGYSSIKTGPKSQNVENEKLKYFVYVQYEHLNLLFVVESRIWWRQMTQKASLVAWEALVQASWSPLEPSSCRAHRFWSESLSAMI